jgi:hypothetical protein
MPLCQHCPDSPVFCRLPLDLDRRTQGDAPVAVPDSGSRGA